MKLGIKEHAGKIWLIDADNFFWQLAIIAEVNPENTDYSPEICKKMLVDIVSVYNEHCQD